LKTYTAEIKPRKAEKNLLFAELIIVTAFFSLSAALCVSLFADAQRDLSESRDLTNAVILAQNAAEIFKSGEIIEVSDDNDDNLTVVTAAETKDGIARAVITVYRGDEIIYSLRTATERAYIYE
jgi:hypothetical protein